MSRLLLGLLLAGLVFAVFGSLPGVARADVVTEPRVTTISTTPATVPPSTTPSATGTTVAPTATTATSSADVAGGMSPGTVALICVIAVVLVAIGSVFIWRGRAKGRGARPGNR